VSGRHPTLLPKLALLGAAALFATLVFKHLSYPLLWNDEAYTAVFGERVLEHGYPVVPGEPSLLYGVKPDRVDPETGAYFGGLWGTWYVAALGVALAEGSDDLYRRTARVRLPFALIGCAGVGVLALGLLPSLGGGRRRRWLFGALFALASAYSVSLILHLREANYYGPVVFLVACLVVLFVRRQFQHRLGFAGYCVGVWLGSVALFNVFHPAFLAVAIAMAAHHAGRALGSPGPPRTRLHELLREALPLGLAAATVLPLALGFDLWGLLVERVQDLSGSARSHAQNLAFVVSNLLRYEFAAPALVARLGVLAASRHGSTPLPPSLLRQRTAIAGFLWILVGVYVLIVTRSPLVWERYFVALSPLLTSALLLDAISLAEIARGGGAALPAQRRRARAGVGLVGVCVLATAALRVPEFLGRLDELRTPYRGPLDFVIPYLKERYPDPSRLVIATNYEGPAYTFYLHSRVIVGSYGGNLPEDLDLEPDVIVPRPWPHHLPELGEMARRGEYVWVDFPVASQRTNNVPSLWPGSPGAVRHEFRTLPAATPEGATFLLERAVPRAPPR
jgi:hypothetical protein